MGTHAHAMFESFTSKKAPSETMQYITLVDFMSMFFPHLPRGAVKKAVAHYEKPPPPPPKKMQLQDLPEAKEEIKEMFDGLDSDKDGLVRVSSLKPLMADLGISEKDLADWMTELPPVLHRPQGGVASEFGLMTGLTQAHPAKVQARPRRYGEADGSSVPAPHAQGQEPQ